MRRVGIVTINSYNIGNRLQNYALQEILKQEGHHVYTIKRKKETAGYKGILFNLRSTLRRIARTKGGLFSIFDKKYICFSKYYATADEFEEGIKKEFDYFIAGSDQIWNPYYSEPEKNLVGACDFLIFAESNQKISYAASFGVAALPQEKKDWYASALNDFFRLSVREEAGVKIIKELTGRDAKVVLDPTLLLSADDWYKVARKPACFRMKKNYILVYALGKDVKAIYEELDFLNPGCVFDVMKKKKNGRLPAIGPSEFVYLVAHADSVLTNSFHATVFSIIFHKPVKAFPRDEIDINSRIVSLASIIGLEKNFSEDGVFYIDRKTDYKEMEIKLEEAKKKSFDFLKSALL